MKKLIDYIIELDGLDDRPIQIKVLKMMEELGELAESLLIEDGYKQVFKEVDLDEVRQNTKEEVADLFIMTMCAMNDLGMDQKEFKQIVNQKLEKWKKKIEKKKSKTS